MTVTVPTPLDIRNSLKNPVRLQHALSEKERKRTSYAPYFAEGVGVEVRADIVVQRIQEIVGCNHDRAVDLLHEGVRAGAVTLSPEYGVSLA